MYYLEAIHFHGDPYYLVLLYLMISINVVLTLFAYFIIIHLEGTFQVIGHFISKYKNQNKFANNENWSPYQCKTFIKLAFVVHTNPKTTNEIVHKHKTMMQVAGNVGPDSEIFFSEVTTQTEIDKIFENPNSSNPNSLPKITLIEGAPGIGKTVVAKEIAYRWAQNTMLSNIKLLLLMSFRDTDISQITCFEDLMLHCYGEDKETASKCAKYFINTQGKSLMIIFDGYDEMATEEQKKDDTFFMKLLNRNSVPECYLVVTSRPYITACLHRYCDCRVEIMGFTDTDRHDYFKENLSPEQFSIVTEFLQEHLIIDSLCYIPLNLMSFLKLVEHTKNKDELPKTQTKLTEHTVRLTIARNMEKKGKFVTATSSFQDKEINKIIKSLASFAYKMLDKEKLVFSEIELKGDGIYVEDDDDKYGLLKAVQVDTVQPTKFYNFVHFSVQEYLAAYHLSTMFNIAQSFALDDKFWDDKYFGVWKMYTGLTDGNKFPLKKFLSGQWYITASLRDFFGMEFPGIHKKLKENKITYLRLYQMFLEAPQSKIKESLKEVVESDTLNLSKQKFTPNDMRMLSYFVAKSCITQQWELIDLSYCNIDDNGLNTFKHHLCTDDGRKKPIIKYLDISNNYNICGLNAIINLITECKLIIHLKASRIFEDKIDKEKVAVNDYCNRTLQILDLSENHLQNENIHDLYNALVNCKNLEKLDLSNNEIDDEATKELVAFLFCNSLLRFEIAGNQFSKKIKLLFKFLLSHLKFSDLSLNLSANLDDLASFITLLEYMKEVPTHKSCYVENISKIRKLNLNCLNHQTTGTPLRLTVTSSEGFQIFSHLESLNISGIIVTEDIANHLVKVFENNLQLEQLFMNECQITSPTVIRFSQQLKFNCLKVFELNGNFVEDEAIEELAIAILHWDLLECIKIEKNRFSDDGMLLLGMFTEDIKLESTVHFGNNITVIKSFIEVVGYASNNTGERVTWFLNNLSKIASLSMQGETQLELTLKASVTLKNLRNLVSLNISGVTITEQVADNICDLFDENNSSLKQLIVNDCGLNSKTVSKFADRLKLAATIVDVQFCKNKIDDAATKPLAITILHWNVLRVLQLENNYFTESSIHIDTLKEFLKFCDTFIDFNGRVDKIVPFITLLGYMTDVDIEKSTLIENVSKVKKLLLNCSEQSNNNVKFEVTASKFFTRFVNLFHLNISGIEISKEVADNLAKALDSNLCSLEHLIMNNCQLTSVNSTNVIRKLYKCVKMRELQLCNNLIDNEATEDLVVSILHLNAVEILRLEQNRFSNTHQKIFHYIINNLKFSDCEIDFSGDVVSIIVFITLLKCMAIVSANVSDFVDNISKIKNLSLDCSKQDTAHERLEITSKASCFFRRFNLTKLNLSGILITGEVINNLCGGDLASVEYLLMNDCNLKSKTVIIFMQILKDAKHIKEIELCNNHIEDDATESLVIAILQWNLLECIKLDGNRFSRAGVLLLSIVTFTGDVEEVDFESNFYVVKSFIKVLDFASNKYSKRVTQFLNNLSKATKLSMQVQTRLELTSNAVISLKNLRNLRSLNVSGIVIHWEVLANLSDILHCLTCLHMSDCCLHSDAVFMLISGMKYTYIDLSDNYIHDYVTERLIIRIDQQNLRLILHGNLLNKESKMLFYLTMENWKPKEISFRNHYHINIFMNLLVYFGLEKGEKSQFTENVTNTQYLYLSSYDNSRPIYFSSRVSHFFCKFSNLIRLDISGINIFKEEAVKILGEAFGNNLQSLEYLRLNNCGLTTETFVYFLMQLKSAANMQLLEWHGNVIGIEAIEAITTAILSWSSLQHISYSRQCFSPKCVMLLDLLMGQYNSYRLDFSNDYYSIKSFIAVLNHVSELTCRFQSFFLNELSLDCTQLLEKVKLPHKALVFFENFTYLIKLNISGITVGEDLTDIFISVFKTSLQKLQYLFMNKCQLQSTVVIEFAKALQNRNVKELQMCDNLIDDKATEALVIAILHWNLLESIKLGKNKFSTHGMLLLEMLTNNLEPELDINFMNNQNVVKSFIKVLDYASNNTGERVSQFLKNLSNTTELCLQVQTPLQLTLNSSITLKNLTNITSLTVSGIIITEKVANNLCDLFDNSRKSFKILVMNNCGLNSNIISKFADRLKLAATIVDVQFCKNKIDDAATKPLAITILHWNVLRVLQLENNYFTESSIHIFDTLKEFLKFCDTFIDFNGRVYKIISFITLLGYMMDVDSEKSALIEKVSKVKKLLLNCSEQYNSNVKFEVTASKFFTRFVNLFHLNISGIEISKEVADNLAKALDSNLCSLEHLIMNNCQLTSVNSTNVIRKLYKCVKMRELQLCNNLIDNEATEDLVVSILHLNAVEILRLEQNRFSNTHQKIFHYIINNLKFSDCEIDFSGDVVSIIVFITLLKCMAIVSANVSDFVDNISKIKNLSLDCSKQDTAHERLEITSKASCFFRRFNLTKLNLSGILITGEVINNLCGGDLASVEYLLMNDCNLKSKTVIIFMQILKDAKHIKEIELCNNHIEDDATESLVIAILQWNLLECIKLDGNRFSRAGVLLLSIVTFTGDVEEVDFESNFYVVKSFIKVLDFASNKYSKRVTQFLNNLSKATKLSMQVQTRLELTSNAAISLKNLRNLRSLNVSGIVIHWEVLANLSDILHCLTCLHMSNCRLNSHAALMLISWMKYTYIDLSNNDINDNVTQELIMLLVQRNLRLILHGNKLNEESQMLFDLVMENWKPKEISFRNGYHIKIFMYLLDYFGLEKGEKSQFTENVTNTQYLCLSLYHNSQPIYFSSRVSHFFCKFSNLIRLDISGINIVKEEAVDILGKAFGNNLHSLEYLRLNNCGLTTEMFIYFLMQLKSAANMQLLEWHGNVIGIEAIEAITTAILSWSSLQHISYSRQCFSPKCVMLLDLLMGQYNSYRLDFSNDYYSITSFIAVLSHVSELTCRFLYYIHNTKELSLDCTYLQEKVELPYEAVSFFKNFTDLIKLNISGITVGEDITDILISVFKASLQELQYMFMNNCQLTSEVVIKFTEALQNKSIIELQMCDNLIDDKATEALVIAILKWKSPRVMLANNKFSDTSLKTLMDKMYCKY